MENKLLENHVQDISSDNSGVNTKEQVEEALAPCSSIDSLDPHSPEIIRVRRKVDRRLIPMLALLYLFSFLDRVNVGNANVAGLSRDLGLTTGQYQLALSIFFVGYILFEIPFNIFLKKFGPKNWISFIMVTWGSIMACMAAVTSSTGLIISRFLLGIAEAGLFPGAVYVISLWYTRSETAVRNGFFVSTVSVAGAFGGILAYGISQMDGLLGLQGWRWIFLIEGIMTLMVAGIAFVWLPNLPEKATFLTEDERTLTIRRLDQDAGVACQTEYSWIEARLAITDWRVWIYVMNNFLVVTCVISLILFSPSIVLSFHFDPVVTQIMTVPCFVMACILTLLLAYSSDKHRERGFHMVIPISVGCLGYILLILTRDNPSTVVRYIALTITITGIFSAAPASIASFSGNIGGHTKRGVATGLIVSMGNVGGIVGSSLYPSTDAEGGYLKGHTVCAILSGLASLSCLVQKWLYAKENRRRAQLSVEEYERESEGEHLCDKHPGFVYIA